ncbi:MAG: 2-(5''-triphosphoribosyl)-3'-dephosphocoenzyme-A synthase [Stenotrophomonas maltophilia]|nr:MAG: 2-(5''-triphosphoribosyl)-3'-dephosphocoenzyme-A synthase [Stenotrophomonas maltophilia]
MHAPSSARAALFAPRSRASQLAELAVQALIDEAELSPKPALVDRRGSGAHRDLDLNLMRASALALQPGFEAMAEAAADSRDLPALRQRIGQIGRDAESAMLTVTAGVNTHRGAIWALGLLTSAAALAAEACSPAELCQRAAHLACLPDPQAPLKASHGREVSRRYGVGGARGEARAGFPAVLEHALPQLRASRAAGHAESAARLDALLAIMAMLADTCVLHRAGLAGQRAMHAGAAAVLEAGGSASLAGRRALRALDARLLQLNASPGGAADLLAACLFIDRLCPVPQAHSDLPGSHH